MYTAILAVAWAAAVIHTGPLPHYPTLPWPAVAAAILAASLVSVTIPIYGSSFNFSLNEVPLVVGAVFLGPVGLLLAVVVGRSATGIIRRSPPSRAIFNTLNYVAGALAALVAYRAVVGSAAAPSMRGWGAAAVAVVAAEAAIAFGLGAVMAVDTWALPRALGSALRSTIAVLPLVVVLVVTANCLTWISRPADLLFIGLAAAIALAQRAATNLSHRYANLERLYRFTERTSRATSKVEDVVADLLRHARDVFGAASAEFVHFRPDGRTVYGLDSAGEIVVQTGKGLNHLARLVIESRSGLLAPRDDQRPDVAAALAEGGHRDAIGAYAPLGQGSGGVLIVADRHGQSSFDGEDLRLLEVLAAHSAVVIRGGTLFEELQEEAAARRHEALHDALTGLSNRTSFNIALADALAHRAEVERVAVFLMDLDGFKEINDTLGHHVGDAVLQEVANRLAAAVGERGAVARLGGDEFAMVVTRVPDEDSVNALVLLLQNRLSRPIKVEGLSLGVRVSLGVSIAPLHGEDRTDLLRHADMAMYAAKVAGSGAEIYDPSSQRHSVRRIKLATDLGSALTERDMEVWYQPQADLITGRIVGLEALLRWRHPTLGQVMPAEFIPLAEQSGTIGALTWLVLERAAQDVAAWSALSPDIGVAVNMAARTLLEADFVERVTEIMRNAGMAPNRLTLELTESSLWSDEARSGRVLSLLRDLGVSIALDDFGTGHSSLTRLKRLPVDVVKIDKSFVGSMSVDDGDLAIVRSTVKLARDLKLLVVAEGVEDQVTWDHLASLGCHRAQGFHLATPMPAADMWDWLSLRATRTLTGI